MEFLKYSNENQCNIIPQSDFEKLTKEVFNVVSTNISRSLGPLGSWATILDGNQTEATKDGFAILKSYRFHNRYKRLIFNMIRAVCTKMNNQVGDGTTTVIAFTDALFKQYEKNKSQLSALYRLPRQFTSIWDETIKEINERVTAKARQISYDDYDTIANLAYVSSNGNKKISDDVAKAYQEGHRPTITQKDSPTNECYIEAIDGLSFPVNLISEVYARNDDLSATEENVCVMIFAFKIETDFFKDVIAPINNVLRAMRKKLLIIAPNYDNTMLDTVAVQQVSYERSKFGEINLILAQYRTGKLKPHQLDDLAVVLGCKKLTQELATVLTEAMGGAESPDEVVEHIFEDPECELTRFIGQATKAILTCNGGSIFKVDGIQNDLLYRDTLAAARAELADIMSKTSNERLSYSSKIYEAQMRVNQLEMRNFIYYVGADSVLQKKIIWDSIDDVIKGLRSATEYGVVPGCQLSIASVCDNMLTEIESDYPINDEGLHDMSSAPNSVCIKFIILQMIYNAVISVYSKVLNGPNNDGILKTIPRWQYTTKEGMNDLIKETSDKTNEIIATSIEKQQVFDIESLDYSDNIITSVQTDTLVLTAASELVKVLISGNQCIFLDTDINESHQESAESYVNANQSE